MRAIGCSVLAIVLLGCVSVREVSPSRDAEAIIALELELTHLLERGAFDEYATHLTSDYALTTSEGELMPRDQALSSWRTVGPGFKMTPDRMQVRTYGDTAILTARVFGPQGGAGDRITKTFVRIKGNWLLAALHVSPIARASP